MTASQDSIAAVRLAAQAADDVKAEDVVAFDVTEPLAITDVFMIASGANEPHVLAIAEAVEKRLGTEAGRQPRSREGLSEGRWVLLDYGDFVVHVMNRQTREFYGLERLWGDCPQIELGMVPGDGADGGERR